MKQLILSLLALFSSLSIANTQVIVNEVDSGAIFTLLTDFSDTVGDLDQSHSGENYTGFVYNFDNQSFEINPIDPFINGLYFREVENTPTFVTPDNVLDIGFFGNESADRNKLFAFTETDTPVLLFDYRSNEDNSNTPAPSLLRLTTNGPISFLHENSKIGFNTQDDPARFKFFQQYNPNTQSSGEFFILAIDDREDSLIDYDDGFFLLYSDQGVTPVPEPMFIGVISVLALIPLIYFRRRK